MMKGPGVQVGGEIQAASIYDIAPTLLALFGQPVPGDFRGRPLLSAFEEEFVEQLAVRYAPGSYTSIDDAPRKPIPSAGDEAMVERLRILGYIE